MACLLVFSCEQKATADFECNEVKNVILMIGDGMGPQQIGLLLTYARFAPNSIYADRNGMCAMEEFINSGVTGLSLTSPADKVVVDSACSATQLATGFISGSEMIGVDASGNCVETVLELAQKKQKATGLVSDTRMTHATPAAFASHVPHRSDENEIAEQLLKNEVDVLLSGGIRHWIPASANEEDSKLYKDLIKQTGNCMEISSKRKDERNLLQEAERRGYDLAFNVHDLKSVEGNKVLGLFSNSGMVDGIKHSNWKDDPKRSEPTLAEMTEKAIEVLSTSKNGFFLMLEGGQIDWAGHANDTADMLHNLIKFDEAIAVILKWAADRDDTVIVLTADHETGGFGFSYSRNNIPEARPLSGDAFKDDFFRPNFNFMDRGILDQIYNQKRNHFTVLADFYALNEHEQTAIKLGEMLRESTGFPITKEEAATVLLSEPNNHHYEWHKYLQAEEFPKVNDFEEFYVYGEEIRSDLIGRILAKYQNAVWATGTHTATPVTVTACGPGKVIEKIRGIKTHPEVGEFLKELIGGNNEKK